MNFEFKNVKYLEVDLEIGIDVRRMRWKIRIKNDLKIGRSNRSTFAEAEVS